MMLMLQQWDSEDLELATFLDECPVYNYIPTKNDSWGEPWRAGKPLLEIASTIDLYGYAWLVVIYQSDEPHTWGLRKVKFLAGGQILRKKEIDGVWSGKYISLKFEVVARDIFRNVIGQDTNLPYKIVRSAHILPEPSKVSSRDEKEEADDMLGIAVKQVTNWEPCADGKSFSFVPPVGLGCVMTWVDEKQYNEKWFIQDSSYFVIYRFCLTEYQRRPFMHTIMARLGFVKSIEVENGNEPKTIEEACAGHLHNIYQSMQALTEIASSPVYK